LSVPPRVIYNVFANRGIATSPIALESLDFVPEDSPEGGMLYYPGMVNLYRRIMEYGRAMRRFSRALNRLTAYIRV
jgi:hypothetical protein